MRYIFDLDGTVVCSLHRKATLADGTLDLAHWIANNTWEKISADSLLPCAETMRQLWKYPASEILVCTARVIGKADLNFLNRHTLNYHVMLSRPEGCNMRDDDLKEIQLRLYAQRKGISWARFRKSTLMYDDAPSVITRMEKIGIHCVNAIDWNSHLKRRTA